MSELRSLALYIREDVRDTIRERQFQALAAIYVLLSVLLVYQAGQPAATGPGRTPELAPQLLSLLTMLTPLLVLGFFSSSIVAKRTNGALKIVLGLPFARWIVVVGTFIGRTSVICMTLLAAFLAAVPVALLRGVAIVPAQAATAFLLLSLFAVTFTALAVGISAVARTTTRATAGAFGVFFLFFFQLWASLPQALLFVRHGFSFPETSPEWVDVVAAVNPVAAYTYLFDSIFPEQSSGTFIQPSREPVFYEEPTFALAVLIGWIVVSIGVASWRFQTTDL